MFALITQLLIVNPLKTLIESIEYSENHLRIVALLSLLLFILYFFFLLYC